MSATLLAIVLGFGPAPAPFVQDPPPPPAQEKRAAKEKEKAEPEAAKPAAPAPPPPPPPPESPWLAIVGGDVYTVTDGVVRGGTVLCRDGRIVAVGDAVRVPDGARRVDARGMRVYPGLVAVNSSGLIRGSGASARYSFDPFSLNVDLALTGGLTTIQGSDTIVRLTRGSLEGHLLGTRPWRELSVSPTSPSSRRDLRAKFGAAREFLREQRAWQLAKEIGKEEGEEPKPEDVDKDALALLRGEAIARFNADGAKDLLAICDFLEEFPLEAVIFGGREAWTVAGRLGRTGARLVLTARDKAWADETVNRPSGWTIENARILHEHGVEFAILPESAGFSTGGILGRDLMNLPLEAAFAIRGGLPQDAALRAITLDAAKILGVEDRIGSIEPGKDADLIVCGGDLFHYRTFVEWAVVAGRVVYDKQKAPYFAHVRPRPEASAEEVLDEIHDAAAETLREEAAAAPPPPAPDAVEPAPEDDERR
jgi:hypothetical protein